MGLPWSKTIGRLTPERRLAYLHRRRDAIRSGTWEPNPHRTRSAQDPAVEPTAEQVAWAAGFFEGEGSVSKQHFRLEITQGNNREPLEKMLRFFGGAIYEKWSLTRDSSSSFLKHRWVVCGEMARRVWSRMLPYLSKKARSKGGGRHG